ncbi:three-Cys-motif partner protein TcmP [Sphingobacterium spiritivorum]|uniref:three-Cys-motif partner protein TcmP n=1 Tax=Sphingobacterium spiritivorum TaxID=258 RepID=UPI00191A368C|nr:three-Cys-motif partner protein TcmP [Sphingobacterium spiritivorum]QQT27526.1 three-Cys-motif partner protein TcmP [Sphingobacterium spiritivorum]
MPVKNLFQKPFDEGTNTKLDIVRQYFEEWLPVFVAKKQPIWRTIQIFDFFAGQGKDKEGKDGSPLIFIQVIKSLKELILKNKLKIILHLNELNIDNFNILVENTSQQDDLFEIKTYNSDFKSTFDKLYLSMKGSANFLFFDQNGIKEITEPLFRQIVTLKQTDFLLFISSSYFKRFSNTDEFKKYFNFDRSFLENSHYYHIHRKVLEHYKLFIPSEKQYYLAPFSIKKERNIYGLIFGTHHTLGIEKFLNVCWKKDKLRGEANYDIDNEKINTTTPFLFDDLNIPQKIDIFEKGLHKQIFENNMKGIKEIYLYTLSEGFLYKDANKILIELKNKRKITFNDILITKNLHKLKKNEFIEIF